MRVKFKVQPYNALLQSQMQGNELVMRIQPDEAVYMKTLSKLPGLEQVLTPTVMDMPYATQFQVRPQRPRFAQTGGLATWDHAFEPCHVPRLSRARMSATRTSACSSTRPRATAVTSWGPMSLWRPVLLAAMPASVHSVARDHVTT